MIAFAAVIALVLLLLAALQIGNSEARFIQHLRQPGFRLLGRHPEHHEHEGRHDDPERDQAPARAQRQRQRDDHHRG